MTKIYDEVALVPASPWLDDTPPSPPKVEWVAERREIRITSSGEQRRWHVVRQRLDGKWSTRVLPADGKEIIVRADRRPDALIVTSIDRVGNEAHAAK